MALFIAAWREKEITGQNFACYPFEMRVLSYKDAAIKVLIQAL